MEGKATIPEGRQRPGPRTLDEAAPRSKRGEFRQWDVSIEPVAPAIVPSLSVCMIARNEADNLRPCLESIGDLASEVILVDTGSDDETVAVAEDLGARVHHFPWVEDFAAARNESIRHATGDWIFWLDADDRLSPKAVAQIKRAATSRLADAYCCQVRSRHADGSQDVTEHVRLFRNGLGIRFTGPVHETVYPDLIRLGLGMARTDIVVEHTGYTSVEVVRAKSARNLSILDRQLRLHPDNLHLLFYRGHARGNLGDTAGAEADMREYLARTWPAGSFDHLRFWAYTDLARALEKSGKERELERVLRRALQEFPDHPYLLAALGRVLLAANRAQQALEKLHAAHDGLCGPVRGLWPPEAWVELGLAECYRAMGRRDQAISWAERARAHSPGWDQAAALLARLHLEAGTVPGDAKIRGLVFLAAGDPLRAAESFAEAVEAAPSDPGNYRCLAAALQRLGREAEAMEAWRLADHWDKRG